MVQFLEHLILGSHVEEKYMWDNILVIMTKEVTCFDFNHLNEDYRMATLDGKWREVLLISVLLGKLQFASESYCTNYCTTYPIVIYSEDDGFNKVSNKYRGLKPYDMNQKYKKIKELDVMFFFHIRRYHGDNMKWIK